MKLIPEQISYLRKKERDLKESLATYKASIASQDKTTMEHTAGFLTDNLCTEEQYRIAQNNYTQIVDALTTAEYVITRDTETVQIGTKFIVEFDDAPLIPSDTMFLIDAIYSLESDRHFVSCSSPLGKSVIGKKEGDKIAYSLPVTNLDARVTGVIKKIITDPEEYVHFIKSRASKNRISEQAQREIHALLTSTDPKDQEEYLRRQEITSSQRTLLIYEAARLERTANDPVQAIRLTNIRKMLKNAKVAIPPTDATIGIGSRFEVILTDGKTIETKSAELINRAVSLELEDEYVERISPLGTKIFGLKTGDTFSVRKGSKVYRGVVNQVGNKNQELTNTNTEGYTNDLNTGYNSSESGPVKQKK